MALINSLLRLLLLATPLLLKDLAVALVLQVYHLHQCIN
jgi:hypothetical protein